MVVAIVALLLAAAIPQMLSARRLMRSAALPREVINQLRFARQQAMSQREAVTFQYDDSTKVVKIFDHNNTNNSNSGCIMTGVAVLSASGYPNTTCTTTILTVPLAGGAIPTADLNYGVPSSITNTTLGDTNTLTALSGNVVNITFQSDGSVVDAAGTYVNRAMFLYNNKAPIETAAAISVLGAAGRIKLWRYDASASQFAE
jgi:Tfp pilus assembly protein FimT